MENTTETPRPRRTPSLSSVPPTSAAEQPPPPDQQQENEPKPLQRKSSFRFLRRGKSTEKMNGMTRTVSNGKLQKKSKPSTRDSISIPSQPPKIPDLATQPNLHDFGGLDSSGNRLPYDVPVPKIPQGIERTNPRAEMALRSRQSYAGSTTSSLNHPRRVRRRKDPTPFNILIVGARNSGKSSFGEFLRASLALPVRKQRQSHYQHDSIIATPAPHDPHFQAEYLETEVAGERIGLTVWDSEGLDNSFVDIQLRKIVAFIESKFNETLTEESKVNRTPGSKDPHIHCVILLLDPNNLNKTINESWKRQEAAINGNLANGKSFLTDVSPEAIDALDDSMDLQVLRALQGKTTVVPIISKADTITTERMDFLKRSVFQQLRASKLDPFEVLGMEEEEQDTNSDSDLDGSVSRHDHKRLDEADEDRYQARLHDGTKSRFDSESSSSSSVVHHSVESKHYGGSAPPLPLSVLTPDPITPHEPALGATTRDFPWGSADPYNPAHCDFIRFKEAIFEEWFVELREASRELWYEGWRTSRLDNPRAKSAASGMSPHREATVPVLSPESKRYLAVTTPSVDGRPSSRNVSGRQGVSPSPQTSQQFRVSPSPSSFYTSQQRSTAQSPQPPSSQDPRSFSRQSHKSSPQAPSGFQPQQAAQQQAQQLFQQQQVKPQQGANHNGPAEQQEVGVAR